MNKNSSVHSIIYTVNDIQNLLNISRRTAYQLVNDPPFPVVRIGNVIRIPQEGFNKWLMGA